MVLSLIAVDTQQFPLKFSLIISTMHSDNYVIIGSIKSVTSVVGLVLKFLLVYSYCDALWHTYFYMHFS